MSIFSEVKISQMQALVDAGGILRVGQQSTLLDGKQIRQANTDVWDIVGTGTDTFQDNKTDLSVASGEYLIHYTKRYFPYFSGKSQRVEATFDNFGVDANVIKRVGYFSSNAVAPYNSDLDGIYLENDGATIRLKVDRKGTSVLNVPLSSWSGFSQLGDYQNAATWDNFTVVEFKFLWLGGAVLVLSVATDKGFTEAHRFSYPGATQDVFIESPHQTLRYEIRSSTGTGSFRAICSQVATEGTTSNEGYSRSVYNSSNISIATDDVTVLLGIRKQVAFRDKPIQIKEVKAVIGSNADQGIASLYINPTLSGALSYSNRSIFQFAEGTGQTVTAGEPVVSVPITTESASAALFDENFLSYLSSTIDNTMDEYILAYERISNNQSVRGIINLKEY